MVGQLSRRGRPVVLDPVRKKLVLDTPEERIRQALVKALHEELRVPYSRMDTEYALNEVDPSVRMRADIVIWGDVPDAPERNALAVIEVKAGSKEVTDRTLDQVQDYAQVLGARLIAAANSADLKELVIFLRSQDGERRRVERLPPYADMLKESALEFAEEAEEHRLSYRDATAPSRIKALLGTTIGEDTSPALHSFVAELDNFILCEPCGAELQFDLGELVSAVPSGRAFAWFAKRALPYPLAGHGASHPSAVELPQRTVVPTE